jgi:hypothetical protein
MADNNPFQQYGALNENGARNNLFDMRMMSAAGHMDAVPRSRFAGGSSGRGGNPMLASMMNGDMNTPDYSQYTYDPAARQAASQYLGQYGLSPVAPENVQHNAVLPNTGFFGDHPRLSAALEGGLFGAAAGRGSDTIGEGISNVAGSLLEARSVRQGMLNRQFEKPFQSANMLEQMQDRSQKRELQEADIQHLRAENQKLNRPDHDFRAFGVSRNDPDIATVDATTGAVKTVPNPNYDPKAPTPGHSEWDDYKAAHPDMDMDTNIKNFTKLHKSPQDPLRTGGWVKNPDGTSSFQEISSGFKLQPGQSFATSAQEGGAPTKAAGDRQKWIESTLKSPGQVRQYTGMVISDKDYATKAAKALGDYFDKNLAPQGNSAMPQPSGQPNFKPDGKGGYIEH